MIKLTNVAKKYDSRAGKDGDLKNINLTLHDTGFVFLLGSIGCGKYTLLNVLSGLETATSGDIEVNGESLNELSPKALDDFRNRNIGVVFKEFNLIDGCSVYENVAISLGLPGKKNFAGKVSDALSFVGLGGYEKRKISELSAGQKLKVAIARAIVSDRQILFVDEPGWKLDADSSKEVFDILKKLSEKILVFAVTRDVEHAKQYGDRVITMSNGEIVSDELLTEIPQTNNKAFDSTNEKPKKRNINYFRLSKLSFVNIWKKKWLFLLTTMLLFLTLTMSGIAISVFRCDKVNTLLEACYDNNLYEFKLESLEYLQNDKGRFSPKTIGKLQRNIPNHTLDFLYAVQAERGLYIEGSNENCYNDVQIAVMDNDTLRRYGYNLCYGKLPTEAGEICLSKYMARKILNDRNEYATDYESLSKVNFKIKMYPDTYFKVVGVVDTKIDDICNSSKIPTLYQESVYSIEQRGSFANSIMVSEDFLQDVYLSDAYSCLSTFSYKTYDEWLNLIHQTSVRKPILSEGYAKLATKQNGVYGEIIYKQGKSSLSANEVIAPYKVVSEIVKKKLNKTSVTNEEILEYINSGDPNDPNALKMINVEVEHNNNSERETFKIVGFYTDSSREEIIVGNEFLENKKSGTYNINGIIIRLTEDNAIDLDLAEYLLFGEGSKEYKMIGLVKEDISSGAFLYALGKNIGLYVGIVAGVFSIVMLIYYTVASIKNSKKQIGILRVLGLSPNGALYIYMLEALMFVALSFVLSIAGVYIVAAIIGFSRGFIRPSIQLLFISPVEIFAMLGLGIAICVLSCIVPIVRKSRMQPNDLIKDLN